MIRIWHQSVTALAGQPEYTAFMRQRASRVLAADTRVDLHGLDPDTHHRDLAPIQAASYRWLSELNSLQVVENVIAAQRQGYDAVAMSCFGDPQIDACRSVVDIPVLGAFEVSVQIAQSAGRSIGLLVPTRAAVRSNWARVSAYGFKDRIALVRPCDPELDEYMMDGAFGTSCAILNGPISTMRSMIAEGADVIIPAEGVLNALLAHHGVSELDGVPILDSFSAVMLMAESLVNLGRKTGFKTSHAGIYRQPKAAYIEHARSIAIRTLIAAQAQEEKS